MYEFGYAAPQTVSEAIELLAEDEDAALLAGGMTLIPTMKQRLRRPSLLIDLAFIPDLAEIKVTDNILWIGAYARHNGVATSAVVRNFCPALADLACNIGDPQVRNRGTIGGSVANNDPAADYPAALLALDAVVVTDRRLIDAGDFFAGMFSTSLETDEIIVAIEMMRPEAAAYVKFPNPASRYAVAGVFAARFAAGYRVAVTGAGPSVFRWTEAEDALDKGAPNGISTVVMSADNLNADIHASGDYRAHLTGVLLRRAVDALNTR